MVEVSRATKAALYHTTLPGLVQGLIIRKRIVGARQVGQHINKDGAKLINTNTTGVAPYYMTCVWTSMVHTDGSVSPPTPLQCYPSRYIRIQHVLLICHQVQDRVQYPHGSTSSCGTIRHPDRTSLLPMLITQSCQI